jgi:hypothetical protein
MNNGLLTFIIDSNRHPDASATADPEVVFHDSPELYLALVSPLLLSSTMLAGDTWLNVTRVVFSPSIPPSAMFTRVSC